MLKYFFKKPQVFFFGTAVLTLLVAVNYYYYYPESDFELGGDVAVSVSFAACWFIFSGYTFVLAGIYYTASKGKLRMRHWLVMLHFVFVVLFLLLFFAFSSFNTPYVLKRISGVPFFTLVAIYGIVFLLDVITFIISVVLLVANIIFSKKEAP